MSQPKLLSCEDSIRFYTSSFQQNEYVLSQTISLNDPASLQRMKIPCRAFDCAHLQCFDYNVFVSMNKNCQQDKSFFKCSVCNERRNPDKIYVDFVALCLLKLYQPSDSTKFFQNGAFQVSSNGSPISKTAATEGTEYLGLVMNSIYDLKRLSAYPYFKKKNVRLKQFQFTSVFDVIHILNTVSTETLMCIFNQPKDRCASIEKLRPYYSTTFQGLYHTFQSVKGMIRITIRVRVKSSSFLNR
jgi:hypothetical protein